MVNIVAHLLTNVRTRPALRQNGSRYLLRRVKAIVIHWTANTANGADADAHRSYFNQGLRTASAHYVVDSTKIIQCIPDTEVAFHCGDKPEGRYRHAGLGLIKGHSTLTPNYFTIGIEMCVNNDGDYAITRLFTIYLAAQLLYRHGLDTGALLRHLDITGKPCPLPMLASSEWEPFKQAVKEALENLRQLDHRTVNTTTLNVRSGPGVNYPVLYTLNQGNKIAIHDIQSDWVSVGIGEWVNGKFLK